MIEIEMKAEAESEDFTGDLSDEALDRMEQAYCFACGGGCSPSGCFVDS